MSQNSRNLAKKLIKIIDSALAPGFWRYVRTRRTVGISLDGFQMCRALSSVVPRLGSIIDIGANRGQFLSAATFFYRDASIFAFEANPELAEQLRRRCDAGGRTQVFCVALGESAGEKCFHISEDSQASSFLQPLPNLSQLSRRAPEHRRVVVSMSRLDDVLPLAALQQPAAMKIDVQGYELNVLRGACETLKRVDHLVVEVSFQGMYDGEAPFREVDGFLREAGFRPETVVGVHRSSGGHYPQVDLYYKRAAKQAA